MESTVQDPDGSLITDNEHVQAAPEIATEYYTNLELFKQIPEDAQSVLKNSANRLIRKHKLEMMVTKRRNNLIYLRSCHQGGNYWLNCVLMTKDNLRQFFTQQVAQRRTVSYYYLGLGIAKLLDIVSGLSFINACNQLIEEWEYEFSNSAVQVSEEN